MLRLTKILFLITQLALAQHSLNIVREDVRIPMRDGITLGAILYRPDLEGKFPALVYRTPYGIDDYDSYAEFPLKAAKQGYLVYLVDVRGRLTSEGEFEAYRNEKPDGYDVIEWVAAQAICNGKVGTYGGSYPGIVQWQAMSQAPPHLLAAAPEMTPIGSHSFIYYGGAFSHPWLDWFTTLHFS
jgi:putative CocE/NonD family hydrolase